VVNGAGNRLRCAQLGKLWLDSLHHGIEGDEAVVAVPSERRGTLWSGGAMARRWWCCGVVLLSLLTEKREKNGWRKVGGGGRWERG
jgi:hypothetical protein